MVSFLKTSFLKYRFFIIGFIIKLLCFMTFTNNSFFKILFAIPNNTLQMIFALSIFLADTYFFADTIEYYIRMKTEILVRVSKQKMYLLFCWKSFLASVLLSITLYCICFELSLNITAILYIFAFYIFSSMLFVFAVSIFNKDRETALLFAHVMLMLFFKKCFGLCI